MARGAGERPSTSTAGLSKSAWASRRRLARPPATPCTDARDRRAAQCRLAPDDEIDDDADRVGKYLGASIAAGHRLAVDAGDPCPFRAQTADAGVPAASGCAPCGSLLAAATGSISSSIAAVQDVQQRHQHLQAQPLGPFHHQPVDLAGGQPNPALRQRFHQVGRGEHASCRPSPAADATGSRVCGPFTAPSVAGPLLRRRPGPSALRSAVFMKSPDDMRVDRGRGVTAVPDRLLNESPVNPVLGQVGDIRVPKTSAGKAPSAAPAHRGRRRTGR